MILVDFEGGDLDLEIFMLVVIVVLENGEYLIGEVLMEKVLGLNFENYEFRFCYVGYLS